MTIDPDRLADLRALKLGALVRERWPDLPGTAEKGPFPDGATLIDREGGRAWALLGEDAKHRLGGALAVARRAATPELHVLVEDAGAAAVLARRAAQFARPPEVWVIHGRGLVEAEPAPPAVEPVLAPEAELYLPVFEAAGLEAVVEGGSLLGEYLGLELARVVVDADGTARVETGVGRFDREASGLVFSGETEAEALQRVVGIAAGMRRADGPRHPVKQLVPERWLRAALVRHPELVGAAELVSVPSAVPRENLLDPGVATAVGTDVEGQPVVVTCSTGVYLDLVPAAADDRLSHAPGARLLLAIPGRDAVPVTLELAERLDAPASVVEVGDDWQTRLPGTA